jgi:hypothetical protein
MQKLVIGQRVKWIWKLVPKNGGSLEPVYMEGEIVGIYPLDDPVTVDTMSVFGRTAHRPWDLEVIT